MLKCSYQLPLGPRHCGSLPRRFKGCHDLIRFDYHKSQPIEILGGRFGEVPVESGRLLQSLAGYLAAQQPEEWLSFSVSSFY